MITPRRRHKGLASRLRLAPAGTEPSLTPSTSSGVTRLDTVFILENENVRFVFQPDSITGVCLASFRHKDSSTVFTNRSRSLWEIDVRKSTTISDTSDQTVLVDSAWIRPTVATFIDPPSAPTVTGTGEQFFEFVWQGVKYNPLDQTRTCNVVVRASLPFGGSFVELTTQLSTTQTFAQDDTNQVCISAVAMPFIAIQKYGTESEQESDFLSAPLAEGSTILQPHKWLRSPRYADESIQFNENGTKSIFGTTQRGISPTLNLRRGTFGCPGAMSMPMLIYGNRLAKAGFLMYALDPDGAHAKNIEFFSDGENLHLRFYDLSDHEIVPYGLGGKNDPLAPTGNRVNSIGWSLRLRPYASPTIWADWYGAKLYKQEVVPELEALDVIPKSYYEQYRDGERGLEESEIPFVCVVDKHMSGDADDALTGVSYLQNLYTSATYPSQQYKPRVLCHFQPVNTNFQPTATAGTGISSNYYGWETWANIYPRGTVSGPTGFRSPDFTGVNSTFSGTWLKMLASGQVAAPYLLFPFTISRYSDWTLTYSGLDLARKPIQQQTTTLGTGDFDYFVSRGTNIDYNKSYFSACTHENVTPTYNKFLDTAAMLSSHGAGAYHDFLGTWGGGCYAASHSYYEPTSRQLVTVSHPRAAYSHGGNISQLKWLSGFSYVSKTGANRLWPGSGTSKYSFAQISEYPSEIQLKYAPHYLQTYAHGACSPYYFSTFNQPARSDALSCTLNDVNYSLAGVEAKTWNQVMPAFSVVYGDRSSATDWLGFWISNALNMSGSTFVGGPPTGVGLFESLLTAPVTHENRQEQFKNWVSSHFASFGRITAVYESLDYQVVNSDWSDVSENFSGVTDSPHWSGYTDYIRQLCRMMAYEPDYIYHGTLEHPLEAWATPCSLDAWTPRAVRPSRIVNAGYASGDDSVLHFTKRHRNKNNLCLALMNWTSGDKGFTGVFDPACYEIATAYDVYRLDLSTAAHGTKTLVGSFPRYRTFTVSGSVPTNSMVLYEFAAVSSLTTAAYLDLDVDYIPVRYSYDSSELARSSLTIAYSHGAECTDTYSRPMVGHRSSLTQQIVNNLPQWMKLRQDVTSNGWTLVNSWGMNAQQVLDHLVESNANRFLVTADPGLVSRSYFFDLDTKALTEERQFDNLLFNSSFAIQDSCRYNLPAGWTNYLKPNYQNVKICKEKSIITPYSVMINGSGTLGQTIELSGVIDKLTASCYVLVDTFTVDVTLLLSVELEDGTNLSSQAKITSRSREWRRLGLTLDVNDKVYRASLIITASCSDTVRVCAPKLETGSQITKWTRNEVDSLPYVRGNTPFHLIQVYGNNTSNVKIPIFPVSTDVDFIGIEIPTRVNRIVQPSDQTDFQQQVIHGRKVSFFNEVFATQWLVFAGAIECRSAGPSQFDVFGRYTIKDLRYDNQLRYGVSDDCQSTVTPITLTVRGEYLFVLCSEQYVDKTFYSLKIVRPVEPPNGETYLESVADFRLDLPLDADQYFDQISEQPTSMAFSVSDTRCMVVNTNLGRRFYFYLYFDYYFYNSDRRRVYTLEDYKQAKIQVL